MPDLQEQVDSLALSLSILTIGLYAAGCAEDEGTMQAQLRSVAVHAQAVIPEPMYSILMEKIGINPFREQVDAERKGYDNVMGR